MADRIFMRLALRAALASLALAGLAGCGNSASAPQCSFFSDVCNPDLTTIGGYSPSLTFVVPQRQTLQVGSTAVFTSETTAAQPSYQWQRSADGGKTFHNIAGANAGTLTLDGVRLSDDATVVRVLVQDGATVGSGTSTLLVSSVAAVQFQDSDFADANWSTSELVSPTSDAAAHSEQQQVTGGDPAPFRSMTHTMAVAPGLLWVFHVSTLAAYDPATAGAIHAIDYREECIRQPESTLGIAVKSALSMEQGGRQYVAPAADCAAATWAVMPSPAAMQATDFKLVSGAPCTSGEACPDFSAAGAPMHFGYARKTSLIAGDTPGTVVHGIDNWQVTIWRP